MKVRLRDWWRHHKPLALFIAAVSMLAGLQFFNYLVGDIPGEEEILSYRSPQTSKVFARDGRLVATLYEQNRTPVKLEEISQPMREAIVAIEDSRFYEHSGIDGRGIARAFLSNLRTMSLGQGASTITMQLARNRFLSNEKTFRRKLREAVLSRRIESLFSKDQILELYLNQVYFGDGAYGIDAAASTFFSKNPSQLTYAESALLAGLVQAPAHLSPFEHLEAAKERQEEVLQRLAELDYLDQAELRQAQSEADSMTFPASHRPAASRGLLKSPYFTTYAIREAAKIVPEQDLYRQGLEIYTTLDFDLQREAESIVSSAISNSGKGYGVDNAALVVIENDTGAIRAMVGGTGWSSDNQFNRAWQALRQPGSAFKPFVYAQVLEDGYHPNSLVVDRPETTRDSWQPRNYDHKYMGVMTIADALRLSRNVVAVNLIKRVGPEKVADLASRMGLSGELPAYPSLALGSAEVSPLDMARAYATFAREGETIATHAVKTIRTPMGESRAPVLPSTDRVLTVETSREMIQMMRQVVLSGTGQAAQVPGYEVAGKTGTTDGYRDAWFVGFSPRYTLAVWVGNDDRSPTLGVAGGSLPAQIFSQVMAAAEAGQAPLAFHPPVQQQVVAHQWNHTPIRAYNYTDAGQEVTVLTNRSLEYEEVSSYDYDTTDASTVVGGAPEYDTGEWRYYEFR